MSKSCIFCRIVAGELSAFFITESKDFIVIKDIAPKAPIHYLIILRAHVQDMASLKDYSSMISLGKTVKELALQLPAPASFQLITNNGAAAGQSIFHLHFHFLSGNYIPLL